MSRSASENRDQPRRWQKLAPVPVLAAAFAVYALLAVPHLTNVLVGDSEFSGWSGPMGERLLHGARPYVDFVLPIPPGSFVVMAAIQAAAGKAHLIQELWVAAVCHLLMALLAYTMARPITTRANALAVSAATLATVVQLYKECAYDHTAQVVAWASVAAGVHALFSEGKRRSRLWFLAGTLASFTFAFKQSTGSGMVAGWVLALSYLGGVALASGDRAQLRGRLADARPWALGAAVGTALVFVVVLAVGSTPAAFIQAVFLDGPELKGGNKKLLFNLFGYLFRFEAFPASLGLILILAWIVLRVLRRDGRLAFGDEPQRTEPQDPRPLLAVLAVSVIAFGAGALALLSSATSLPALVAWSERAKAVPSFGLVLAGLVFLSQLERWSPKDDDVAPRIQRGHVLNAVVIAAFVCSMLHNLSFPGFRPFYDNNPIIPISFLFLFVALDRAALPRFKILVLAFSMTVLHGTKLERSMEARIPVSSGYFAGLYVNERGAVVMQAAEHVRELTKPDDTVLVLPEDLELVGLIDRPRPPIRGAIVFVDQYPRRLLANDLATLDAHPPKVVVIHPSEPKMWRGMFSLWSTKSAAQSLTDHYLNDVLPSRYVLDRRYPTRFARTRANLSIWVRKD